MMKGGFLIIIFFLLSFSASAQLLKLSSKDSLNNKPQKELYFTAWVKMSGIYDIMGISNTSALNLPSIPTDGSPRDPHFTMDMFQTRLIFASTFQTKRLGEILSYIETDFFGNNGGGLRLRHAYIRFRNFRIGQTWSGFTDEESWPNITDFDGPATGAWVRQPQIAYFIRPNESQDILFSLETPTADYNRYLLVDSSLNVANQRVPDMVTHYEKRWPKAHLQVGAVYRLMEYRDANNNLKFTPGWGFNISGSQIFYMHDKFVYQVLFGTGISKYLVSFGGSGWDAIPDLQGNLLANPVWGGYISYQHFWGEHTSSTFVYGYAEIYNPLKLPSDKLFAGSYASGNLYWHIVGPLNFAGEVIYGTHYDEFNRFGDNIRFQFVFEYNF